MKAARVDVRARTLSGGNQQKVMIGRWLDHPRKVVVIDEPTAGIDIASKFEIYDQLRQLAADGAAVLVCTTDFQEVGQVADRVSCCATARSCPSSQAPRPPSITSSNWRQRHDRRRRRCCPTSSRHGAESVDLRRLLGGDAKVLLPLVLAIVALSIYTGTQNDAFLSWTNAENVMLQSSVLGIVALGQTYLIAAGQLDLSVGSLASFIGVLGATMLADGSSEAVMFVTCLLAGAIVGLVWGLVVTKLRVPPFILTLGGLSVLAVHGAGARRGRPGPGAQPARLAQHRWAVRTAYPDPRVRRPGADLGVRHAIHPLRPPALRQSVRPRRPPILAGLPTDRTKIVAFVVNSTFVAIAGMILMARIGAGDPRAGTGLELKAIAAVVLGGATLSGGRGSALGTFLGVVLLGVVGASLTFLDVDSSYEDMVFGGVLIFAVVMTALGDRNDGTARRLFGRLRNATRSTQPPNTGEAQ